MVNSKKKMNKSTVAIVVLALLLIVSLVLTATGAWFTSSGTADDDGKGGVFGYVTVAFTADAGAKITRADGTTIVAGTADDPIMPGDIVSASKYTLTLDDKSEDAFYLIKSKNAADTKFYVVSDGKLVEATEHVAGTLTSDAKTVEFQADAVTISGKDTGNDKQGTDYTAATSGYTVYAIQQANLSNKADKTGENTNAYDTIVALVKANFPANKGV